MKILIVRFSSFGDIVQTLPCVRSLKKQYPEAEINWLTRIDFTDLVSSHPLVTKVIALDRDSGLIGLLQLAFTLRKDNYTHVYDAHNNLRSFFLRSIARLMWGISSLVVRPKNRWKRFLFFKFRKPVFKMPFRGALSFTEPLQAWNIPTPLLPPPHLHLPMVEVKLPASFIVLAPSAAWPTKRWPLEYWKQLISLMPESHFVVLGGAQDTFCEELVSVAPDRVHNFAGRSSLIESCVIVNRSLLTISGDTGILHAADQLGVSNIGLIGPTAFGYTSQPQSHILETELYCKPCSKDGRTACVNPIYQKCMKDISPASVAALAQTLLQKAGT